MARQYGPEDNRKKEDLLTSEQRYHGEPDTDVFREALIAAGGAVVDPEDVEVDDE